MPAFYDLHATAEGVLTQLQHPVINLFAVERRWIVAVFVRIPDDQIAIRGRADQQVNTVIVQMRAVAQNLLLHCGGLGQIGKRPVMHAAQAREQSMLQVQRHLRAHTQHLQATDFRRELRHGRCQQGLVIVARTDNHLRAFEAARGGVHHARFDVAHQG